MTSQLFWSASSTNVTLSPSAFTVPLRLLRGAAAAALSLPMSLLLLVSCATAAMLKVTQIAITRIHSFFIERNLLWKNCPVELDSLVQYESSAELDVSRREMLQDDEIYFSRATTNSGAHSRARLISDMGNVQMAFPADSDSEDERAGRES